MKKRRFGIFNDTRKIATLLLYIFVAYYTNVTLFLHYHVVDGVTIVHSHICSEEHAADPDADNHSTTELTLISTLSNFVAELQDNHLSIDTQWIECYNIYVCPATLIADVEPRGIAQLRAPPALLV